MIYSPVSFSQGSGVERRGCAVLHRAATHLWQNPISTFLLSTCPAWGWMRIPAVGPGKVSEICGRTVGETIGNWRVFGRQWCLQLVTAEISNVSASRQTTAYWCALGEEEWTCEWEWFLSAAEITVFWLFQLTNLEQQIATKSHKWKQDWLINWLGFFCLRRNSCADSLRGQYARMGPLQCLFLCGLLYTQTDGKFMNKSITKCYGWNYVLAHMSL